MLPYENSKIVSVCPYLKKRNHPSSINISPTLVIDTSMERSSRVPTTSWKPKKKKRFSFFKNGRNWILTCAEVLKLPKLRQYQSYSSNWCINGKVFTTNTAWKPKNLIFFSKKVEIEFWLVFCVCKSATRWPFWTEPLKSWVSRLTPTSPSALTIAFVLSGLQCHERPNWVELSFYDRNSGGHLQGHRAPHPKLCRPHLVHHCVLNPSGQTWDDSEQSSDDRDRLSCKGLDVPPQNPDWGPPPKGTLRTVFSPVLCQHPVTHSPQSSNRLHRPHCGPSFQLPFNSHGLGPQGYMGDTPPGSSIPSRAPTVQHIYPYCRST